MKISRRFTAVLGVAAAMALPVAAHAQTFNYFTTGQFSGAATCNGAAGTVVTCGPASAGSPYLKFTGQGVRLSGDYLSPSNIVFGQFTVGGVGSQTVPAGVMFTLFVNQTNPTTGQSMTSGSLTGKLTETSDGNGSSSLVWTPDSYAFSIGNVDYAITPHAPVGIGDAGATSINGQGMSTVPEPSSMALLGTGLFGLVPMIRRKRQK